MPTRKPKLAKEYVFPAHGQTNENKTRAHNNTDTPTDKITMLIKY
jgi:hypothetical protein